MSLLSQASICITPNGYKEGKLYSVIPSDGSGDMSVVRATTATRVNSAGLVELVPYNLVQYSEQFDTVSWFKSSTTITANSGVAPNGTTTADKIVPTTTGVNRWAEQSRAITIDNFYTNSAYIKADGFSWVAIHHIDGSIGAWFNVSNGTVGTVNAGCTASIESVGNGWYRCSVAKNSGGTTGYAVVQLADADNSGTATASGTNGLLIWGAQLNEGTIKPYQKTETRLNIPRLDYSNGTCPSLLVEPQRTNLVTYSSSFDNAAWTKLAATITANSAISPSGIQDADKLIPNTTATDHAVYQIPSVTQSINYTYSCFAKSAGYSYLRIADGDGNGAYFDLTNGTIVGSLTTNPKIESIGNGWYRCSMTAITSGTSTLFAILPSSNGTTTNFAGNGTDGVLIYGAQLEAGNYSTSYIPTTSASVTRNADVISKTGISSLIGQTEGTIFWDIYIDTPSASLHEDIFNIDGGTFGNTIYLAKLSNSTFMSEMYLSSVQQATFTKTGVTAGRHKIAFAYANNNTAMFFDGVQVGSTDTSCSVPAMSRIQLGQGVFGPSTGFTNAAAFWQTRLTNDQLATLTTL
jgi:hypothetical protein